MAEDDVSVKFGASIEGLLAGVSQIQSRVEELTGPLTEMQERFAAIGEAFAAAFAVDQLAEFVERVAELGEQAERTAEMLGLTVQQVTDLQFAAAVTGGSSEGMTRALEQLERAMSEAHNASSVQAAAFQSLGISTQFLKDHQNDLMGVLAAISQRFAETADGPAKTADAMALLGRSGAEMIPMLNRGSEGLAEFKKQAQEAGVELSGPTAAGMAETAEKINQFKMAVQGLSEHLFGIFKPAIDAIVGSLTRWAEELTTNISKNDTLRDVIEGLAFAFDVVVGAVEGLVAAIQELWTIGSGVIQALRDGLLDLGHAMSDALSGNWSKVQSDLSSGWDRQVANFQNTADRVQAIATETVNSIKQMFSAQMSQDMSVIHVPTGSDGKTGSLGQLTSPGAIQDAQRQAAAMAKEHEKAAKKVLESWTQTFDQMGRAFDTQLMAVIRGKETIGQAFENLGMDVLSTMLETVTKSIAASAAQAFAGTFGFLSPEMGPAAAAPAAAAQASVMAVGAAIPSFDVGSWNLPSDMVAQVHQGETIIPAGPAADFRSLIDALQKGLTGGGSGGGHTFNITQHGIGDGIGFLKNFQQLLRDYPAMHNAILARP